MTCMVLATIYALFGDDAKYLINTQNTGFQGIDNTCNSLTCIVIAIFTIEIILQIIIYNGEDRISEQTKKKQFEQRYFLSLNFWLDVVSTVSLLLDITWFTDSITDVESSNRWIPQQMGFFSKTSRGIRIGSRAGRIVRLTRIFRTERLVQLCSRVKKGMTSSSATEQLHTQNKQEQKISEQIVKHIDAQINLENNQFTGQLVTKNTFNKSQNP